MAASNSGQWEVDVAKGKILLKCGACEADRTKAEVPKSVAHGGCGEAISREELRCRWCPTLDSEGVANPRPYLHLKCAIRAGEDGTYAKFARVNLRKFSGLPKHLLGELNATFEAPTPSAASKSHAAKAEASVTEPTTPLGGKAGKESTATSAKKIKAKGMDVAAAPPAKKAKVELGQSPNDKTTKHAAKAKAHAKVAKAALPDLPELPLDEPGLPAAGEGVKKESTKVSKAKAKPKVPAAAKDDGAKAVDAVAGEVVGDGGGDGAAQKKARLTDISAEPLAVLSPIIGVMDVPRKTLMEAADDTGIAHMDACGFMAAEKGGQLAADDRNGLDEHEAGALTLYTMESELYPTLNAALRDRDRARLKPFFPFLQLMLLARAKLPKFVGTVWRGVKADLRKQYTQGKEVYWWAFSSTTQRLSTLNNPMFLGQEGVRTVFSLQVRSGVDIARYSVFEGEEAEVLLFPGTKFKVVDGMDMGGGLYQVHLEEVVLPVQLIK